MTTTHLEAVMGDDHIVPPDMSQRHFNQPNPAIERLRQEAEEAWGLQDYSKSIRLLEKATRKEPNNPSLVLELARSYGRRYDFPAAERIIEKAVQISNDRAQTLGEAAKIWMEFDDLDTALRYLTRATQKKDVGVEPLTMQADIYVRDKRLDEAADLTARAAQIDKRDGRVLLVQATLMRLRGEHNEAEAVLRDLVKNPAVTIHVRVRAAYELAGILDSAAQYDEAMAVFLEAKAILRPHSGPYAATLEHMQSRAKEMEKTITAAVMDRWRAEGARLQPPRRIALLCGHPRSGTTLLEQVLDAHSNVISAEETKLMHDEAYLPLIRDLPEGTSVLDALNSPTPNLLCHARENYFHYAELLLREKIGSRLLLDKNPAMNLMIPMVVRIFPETKFLVALRDPRDVVISCFMQALPLTPISSSYHSIEGTVNQYANVMRFWLEMMPRMGDRWMHVRYEEMIDDLSSVAKSVLGFLGLSFEDNVLKFYEHARAKRVNSPTHADVQKPLYRTALGRWRNYEKYLSPHMSRFEPFLRAFGYQ